MNAEMIGVYSILN